MVVERFSLDLGDHRLSGLNDALLILERGDGVGLAEDVEVRSCRSTSSSERPCPSAASHPALTRTNRPSQVLEERSLVACAEQVSDADTLDLLSRGELLRPASLVSDTVKPQGTHKAKLKSFSKLTIGREEVDLSSKNHESRFVEATD